MDDPEKMRQFRLGRALKVTPKLVSNAIYIYGYYVYGIRIVHTSTITKINYERHIPQKKMGVNLRQSLKVMTTVN